MCVCVAQKSVKVRKEFCLFLTFMSFHAYELKFMFVANIQSENRPKCLVIERGFVFVLKLFIPDFPFTSCFALNNVPCKWNITKLTSKSINKLVLNWDNHKVFLWVAFKTYGIEMLSQVISAQKVCSIIVEEVGRCTKRNLSFKESSNMAQKHLHPTNLYCSVCNLLIELIDAATFSKVERALKQFVIFDAHILFMICSGAKLEKFSPRNFMNFPNNLSAFCICTHLLQENFSSSPASHSATKKLYSW